MTLLEKYPDAFEDEKGTIWVSRQAAQEADWTYEHGDAFIENILGWDWEDAYENFAICQKRDKRKAFWQAHPHLWTVFIFLRRRWNFLIMFTGTVWRDWDGRISWSTAWQIAKDVCL